MDCRAVLYRYSWFLEDEWLPLTFLVALQWGSHLQFWVKLFANYLSLSFTNCSSFAPKHDPEIETVILVERRKAMSNFVISCLAMFFCLFYWLNHLHFAHLISLKHNDTWHTEVKVAPPQLQQNYQESQGDVNQGRSLHAHPILRRGLISQNNWTPGWV